MTATAATNGKPARKQLSSQLDRLDEIIDLLATALPEAVAEACREGTKQAVKEAVVELLTNAELRAAMLAGLTPPATPEPALPAAAEPPKPGFWSRAKSKLIAATTAAAETCRVAKVTGTARLLATVMPVKKIALVGLGVGFGVGLLALVSPHAVAALLSAAGGACTAVAVQAGRHLKRSAVAFGFATG